MEHLAIMKKSWNLTQKILDGKKTIESRWYVTRRAPYDRIKAGDIVYFKDSGGPVSVSAQVSDVKQFSDLTPSKVRGILEEFADQDGIEKEKIGYFSDMFKDKKYCMLIFLKNPKSTKPFEIDKKGYGIMSAWICINKIDDIKKK
jgi:ASC-1-like (ASCH) protein